MNIIYGTGFDTEKMKLVHALVYSRMNNIIIMLSGVFRSSSIGPALISNHALRKLAKKQLQAWRPIQTRLLLLKQLVKVRGVHPPLSLNRSEIEIALT